jgi:hypothetical protein
MKKVIKTTISVELEVEVVGYYEKEIRGDYTTESFPPAFHVEKVNFKDVDVTTILTKCNFDWSSLEDECLEKIKDGR